jgi:acetyl-CoA carboxylase biotin carboxyl carrier protein
MAKKSKTASGSSPASSGVDLREVERLLEFMQDHGLEEFEYERNGLHIRLRKPSSAPAAYSRPFPPVADLLIAAPSAPSGASAAAAPGAAAAPPARESAAGGRSEDLHVVKSPIVGTFYASASPGAEVFVTVGSSIDAGQVLCIIEAMKLMNEIESDVAGEVVRVFVENGQPVEYGEPLFGIHPHRKK